MILLYVNIKEIVNDKNIDCGIAFDVAGSWSFCDLFARNVVILLLAIIH